MDLPPDYQKAIDDMTASINAAHMPALIAAALLPIEKDVKAELQHWHAELPLKWQLGGKPRLEFFVSVLSDLSQMTWQTAGETPDFYAMFLSYLEDYPIDADNLEEFKERMTDLEPDRLGVWINAQSYSFELGWYIAPPSSLYENAVALLPQCSVLEQINAWAEKYAVIRCPRVGRSLVTQDRLSELFLVVNAETSRRSLEIALILLRYLGLEYPTDNVLAALFSEDPREVVVSLCFGLSGLARVGILLGSPSTVQFLRLNAAVGKGKDQQIAVFEGALGVNQIDYLEYQVNVDGEGVELHYALH